MPFPPPPPPRPSEEVRLAREVSCVCIGDPLPTVLGVALAWSGWEDVCLHPLPAVAEGPPPLRGTCGGVVVFFRPDTLPLEAQERARAVLASALHNPSVLCVVVAELRSPFWQRLQPAGFTTSAGWNSAVAGECCYAAAHHRPFWIAANSPIVCSLEARCARVHYEDVSPVRASSPTAALISLERPRCLSGSSIP